MKAKRYLIAAMVALAASAPLGGCALLRTPSQQPEIFAVRAGAVAPVAKTVEAHLVVMAPWASAALDTERMAVETPSGGLAYLPDGHWTDTAPRMVRAGLVAALADSGAATTVVPDIARLDADVELRTELRAFQAVERDGRVVARIDLYALLAWRDDARVTASRLFTAEAPAAGGSAAAIAQATSAAFTTIAADVAAWTASSAPVAGARR